ncbi:T9SS type A sorting domain-containing protein, partial [candidate division KSB1 bacterium]|nr:T9SS type A sorting domain-containing protein [candidate division KSB1 bacterium]
SPNFQADQTVFATIFYEGLFQTKNGGASWEEIEMDLPDLFLRKVVLSPDYSNDHTLFILSAQGVDNSTNYLYKSTDGGISWNLCLSKTGLAAFAVSPNFKIDQTMIAGAHYGQIYVSTDGGKRWRELKQSIFRPRTFAFSPNFVIDSTIFCGNFNNWAEGEALFKTHDAGANWDRIIFYPIYSINHLAVSPEFSQDQRLFAATGEGGIWRSDDGGVTWEPVNQGLISFNIGEIQISPEFSVDHTLYISTSNGIFKSTNGGSIWSEKSVGLSDLNTDVIVISPDFARDATLFTGTHDGIFKTTDGGETWFPTNAGIPLTDFMNVSRDATVISTLPTLVADAAGYTHIAYWGTFSRSDAPDGVTTDVFYTNNVNGNFFKPIKVAVPDGYGWYSKDLDLAVDSDGFAHIAFRRAEDQVWGKTNDDIFYATNKSGVWTSEIVIEGGNRGIAGPNDPVLGVDRLGTVHLMFESFGYYYWKKKNDGRITGPIKVISDNHGVSDHSIAVEPNGTVHFVYNAKSSRDAMYGDLHYRIKTGDVFSDPHVIAYGMEADPSLDIDKNGKVHIAFHDRTYSYYTTNAFADTFTLRQKVGSVSYQAAKAVVREFDGNIFVVDEGGKFYFKTDTEFNSVELIKSDLPLIGGKSFFDLSSEGIAQIAYHAKADRIYGSPNHDIYFLAFDVEAASDQRPPAKIYDLRLILNANDSLMLIWTATGDDDLMGTASQYDLRYDSNPPLNDTTTWWNDAQKYSSVPSPSAIGRTDSVVLRNLSLGQSLYFAIKVADNAGNWSGISNIASNVALPVELSIFEVIIENEKILLKWQTYGEIQNLGFDIQRRTVNTDFHSIGFIKGQGTVTNKQLYTFEDKMIVPGTVYYYRLKQMDADGAYTFSKTITAITCLPQNFALHQNFPNPFNPSTTVKYQLPFDTHVTLTIFNAKGQEVERLVDADKKAGFYAIRWNALGKSTGIYFVVMQTPNFERARKMMMIR